CRVAVRWVEVSAPNRGTVVDAAQSRAGSIDTKCTASVSPGSAPSTWNGPVCGFTNGNSITRDTRSPVPRTRPAKQSSVNSCSNGLNSARPARRKYPMQARFVTMYAATMRITSPVATMPNAVTGSYPKPSPNEIATVAAVTSRIATTGERRRVDSRASAYGNAPIRPIAYAVRVDTFTPAFALATVEFTIARNTSTQKAPYRLRETPSHESAPEVPKVANLSGPKATSTAYVVKMYRIPMSSVASSTAR